MRGLEPKLDEVRAAVGVCSTIELENPNAHCHSENLSDYTALCNDSQLVRDSIK